MTNLYEVGPFILESFPNLKKNRDVVKQNPKLADYLEKRKNSINKYKL